MQENNQRITELELKAVAGSITPEEEVELLAFLHQDPENLKRFQDRTSPERVKGRLGKLQQWEQAKQRSLAQTLDSLHAGSAPRMERWKLLSVAASLILLLSGLLLYGVHRKSERAMNVTAAATDIKPGGNKATLTLGNGTVVALGDLHQGAIAQQGGTQVSKTDASSISYEQAKGAPAEVLFNTITTPRGGQYRVLLPDGSVVWLNAASSITFPTAFVGDRRSVTVTGEAYFDIAKDVKRPFEAKVGQVNIQVLGTSFDVSAYADEPVSSVRTTLLSGKVQVTDAGKSVTLHPGQQAKTDNAGKLGQVSMVDTASVVAWKNGDFRFRGASIDEVMRQLSRWYDIEVTFQGQKPEQTLTADVSRNLPASEVLKALELSGYHCKITDGKIVIMP